MSLKMRSAVERGSDRLSAARTPAERQRRAPLFNGVPVAANIVLCQRFETLYSPGMQPRMLPATLLSSQCLLCYGTRCFLVCVECLQDHGAPKSNSEKTAEVASDTMDSRNTGRFGRMFHLIFLGTCSRTRGNRDEIDPFDLIIATTIK